MNKVLLRAELPAAENFAWQYEKVPSSIECHFFQRRYRTEIKSHETKAFLLEQGPTAKESPETSG